MNVDAPEADVQVSGATRGSTARAERRCSRRRACCGSRSRTSPCRWTGGTAGLAPRAPSRTRAPSARTCCAQTSSVRQLNRLGCNRDRAICPLPPSQRARVFAVEVKVTWQTRSGNAAYSNFKSSLRRRNLFLGGDGGPVTMAVDIRLNFWVR